MNSETSVVSKVLVLDDGNIYRDCLKAFFEDCGLVGIRPNQGDLDAVMSLLASNVDLGGIMLFENYGGEVSRGLELARKVNLARPELPIFLRRESIPSVAGLDTRDATLFRCAYTLSDLQLLRDSLDASLFSRVYPTDLVRGINEITRNALETLFHDCDIEAATPYLVKDRIIYGEVFTLIAIERNWCRGYMMLQASEEAVLSLVRGPATTPPGFRDLNSILGEATNLVWGSFKNRFAGEDPTTSGGLLTQVPIVINHQRRYISFGSEEPQLCLKYILRDRRRPEATPVPLFQRFVFNLNWSPEQFRVSPTVESLVASGELEMF